MKIDISPDKQAELYQKGYDLGIIAFLELLKYGKTIPDQVYFSKLEAKCTRKGIVMDGKITSVGKELLEWLDKPENIIFEKKKLNDDVFNLWWESYPKLDSFTYRGRSFAGSRSLRLKKDDCKIKLKAILDEGEHSMEDMIRSLNYEISQKMEKSYKEGRNCLSFMQNSLTYLTQRTFENFMEISKKEEKIEIFNGTDI